MVNVYRTMVNKVPCPAFTDYRYTFICFLPFCFLFARISHEINGPNHLFSERRILGNVIFICTMFRYYVLR